MRCGGASTWGVDRKPKTSRILRTHLGVDGVNHLIVRSNRECKSLTPFKVHWLDWFDNPLQLSSSSVRTLVSVPTSHCKVLVVESPLDEGKIAKAYRLVTVAEFVPRRWVVSFPRKYHLPKMGV